jgi:hypothetical protein
MNSQEVQACYMGDAGMSLSKSKMSVYYEDSKRFTISTSR